MSVLIVEALKTVRCFLNMFTSNDLIASVGGMLCAFGGLVYYDIGQYWSILFVFMGMLMLMWVSTRANKGGTNENN